MRLASSLVLAGWALISSYPAYSYYEPEVTGVCRGRPLPQGKTRKLSNLRLECESDYRGFVRGSQSIISEKWEELQETSHNADPRWRLELRREMQALRQSDEDLIQWSGRIPYQTVEAWTWQEEVYGPHPSCGYQEVVSYEKLSPIEQQIYVDTDDTLLQPGDSRVLCHVESGQMVCYRKVIRHEMKSCLHDETRHEARHCSSEEMIYSSEFVRPSQLDWNPSADGYLDILPNKYDLLPGEVESIRIYNTTPSFFGFRSLYLAPHVEFRDARNDYNADIRFLDSAGNEMASEWKYCQVDYTPKIKVKIHTVKRVSNLPSPNPFVAKEGESLSWLTIPNKKGEIVRSRPFALILEDISHRLIEGLAKETRVNAAEVGATGSGFWKNTVIRIRLVQLGWNIWLPRWLYTDSAQISLNEEQKYVVPLMLGELDIYSKSEQGFWGKLTNWLRVTLQPNRQYRLYVSAYQKGVPFYQQACDENSYWFCTWFRGESSYFSPEISVDFDTDSDVEYHKL